MFFHSLLPLLLLPKFGRLNQLTLALSLVHGVSLIPHCHLMCHRKILTSHLFFFHSGEMMLASRLFSPLFSLRQFALLARGVKYYFESTKKESKKQREKEREKKWNTEKPSKDLKHMIEARVTWNTASVTNGKCRGNKRLL